MNKTKTFFKEYCRKIGLKKSKQRDRVVDLFLSTEQHISAYKLFNKLINDNIHIGYSTVYRTLQLLVKAGLAQTIKLGGETCYEHKYEHRHHDHFVCYNCGATIEFSDSKLENIQNKIAKKYNFTPLTHNLLIYGVCKKCKIKN